MTPPHPGAETKDRCPSCAEGRLGAWSYIRMGGEIATLGKGALAARECDRCCAVQVATTSAANREAEPRKHSPGGDLLHGVLNNLARAVTELWEAVWAARRTRGGR
jgi:hypothetical protein